MVVSTISSSWLPPCKYASTLCAYVHLRRRTVSLRLLMKQRRSAYDSGWIVLTIRSYRLYPTLLFDSSDLDSRQQQSPGSHIGRLQLHCCKWCFFKSWFPWITCLPARQICNVLVLVCSCVCVCSHWGKLIGTSPNWLNGNYGEPWWTTT